MHDQEYLRRRAEEERERSAAAADPCAKKSHDDMANEYARLAATGAEPELTVLAQ
jgi:hypothetical protein